MTGHVNHPVNHHENGPPIHEGPEGRKSLQHNSGGGGTRTPMRLPAPHFECGALPVRTTPPVFSRDGRI
jgi:hypothetical protein